MAGQRVPGFAIIFLYMESMELLPGELPFGEGDVAIDTKMPGVRGVCEAKARLSVDVLPAMRPLSFGLARIAVRQARSTYGRKRACSVWDLKKLELLSALIETRQNYPHW